MPRFQLKTIPSTDPVASFAPRRIAPYILIALLVLREPPNPGQSCHPAYCSFPVMVRVTPASNQLAQRHIMRGGDFNEPQNWHSGNFVFR